MGFPGIASGSRMASRGSKITNSTEMERHPQYRNVEKIRIISDKNNYWVLRLIIWRSIVEYPYFISSPSGLIPFT